MYVFFFSDQHFLCIYMILSPPKAFLSIVSVNRLLDAHDLPVTLYLIFMTVAGIMRHPAMALEEAPMKRDWLEDGAPWNSVVFMVCIQEK